ncbi:MAG TPA: patatin-like phospholipase family protein [bacterium]
MDKAGRRSPVAFSMVITIIFSMPVFTVAGDPAPADSVKIGLVLSAGGALGLAHVGVLKVLEREGINVSCISANSMGSIIGSLYAAGYTATQIESIALGIDWKKMIVFGLPSGVNQHPGTRQRLGYLVSLEHHGFSPALPSGVANLQNVEFFLAQHLARPEYDAGGNYDSLAIPLRLIAVDLNSGRKITFCSGSLVKAIRGSIAIPGVFAPSMFTNMRLVDGGVMQYLPVEPIKEMEPDLIIASLTIKQNEQAGVSMIDIISRTTSMFGISDIEKQKKIANILIEPDLSQFDATNYDQAKELIAVGEQTAEMALDGIRESIAGRTIIKAKKEITHRPLPFVRKISFEGMKTLSAKKISRILKIIPGSQLDFDAFIKDLIKLYETGLFEHVDYRLHDGGDSVEITIEVHERDFGYYLLGLRYDNYDNATIGLEMGIDNIGGSSFGASGIATLGEPSEYRVRIEYLNPQYTTLFGHIDPFWSSIDRSYYDGSGWVADYNIDCRGAASEINCNLGYDTYVGFGFKAHQALYRFPQLAVFDTLPMDEWIIGPTISVEQNDEAGCDLSSDNNFVRIEWQYAGSLFHSRAEFIRIALITDANKPLFGRFSTSGVLCAGASAGDLPWSERFYTGGASFVGYRLEHVMSRQKLTSNVSLNYRVLGTARSRTFSLYLRLVGAAGLTSDITNILNITDPLSLDYHYGCGIGIWMDTPIGPVQLTTGATDPQWGDGFKCKTAAIFFSIGRDFRYTK